MNDGRRASLAPAPAEMPETQRSLGNATVERREADVPVARDGHASQAWGRVLPARRTKVVRLPALRRPLISGSELQLTPRIWARAPPKRRPRQRRCGGQRTTTRQPGRRKCAAGTRCAVRQRGGLFDIVKNDDGRRAVSRPGLRVYARASPSMAGCRSLPLAGGDRYPSHSA